MERAEFVNDLCCNYLTIPYEGEENDFALRMIMENVTDVFLPVELRRLDGENYLYYNISGLHNMEILYAEKPVDQKTFQIFMWQLHETIEQSRELFLPGDGICLEPSFLFWNMKMERWEFVYVPGREKREPADIQKEREQLAEFLVMRIDYEDKNLTETVYRFYEEICSGKVDPAYFEMDQAKEPKTIWDIGKGEKGTGGEGISPHNVETSNIERWDDENCEVGISEKYGKISNEFEIYEQRNEEPEMTGIRNKIESSKTGKNKTLQNKLGILCCAAAAATLLAGRTAPDMILPGGAVTILLVTILFYVYNKQKNLHKDEKPETEDIIYTEQEEIPYDIQITETEESGRQQEETVYMDIRQEQERRLYGIGKFKQQKIFLDKVPCLIGKDGSLVNHIISDASVSRMHARFFEEERVLWMQDLNSKNGTYHNGLRLRPNEKVMLEPEDEIGFGRVQFVFR